MPVVLGPDGRLRRPRVVLEIDDPYVCLACGHRHAPRGMAAHLGSPDSWNADRISAGRYSHFRPLRGELERWLELLNGKPDDSRSFGARLESHWPPSAPEIGRVELAPPGIIREQDMTVYRLPPDMGANLKCGICLLLTGRDRVELRAPVRIEAADTDQLLVGLTGLWVEVSQAEQT